MKFLNWFKKKAPAESIGRVVKTILFDLSDNEVTWEYHDIMGDALRFFIKGKKYQLIYFYLGSNNVYVNDAEDFKFNKTETLTLALKLDDILNANRQKREDDAYLKSLKKMRTFFPECL
jgi:hypothetical protein